MKKEMPLLMIALLTIMSSCSKEKVTEIEPLKPSCENPKNIEHIPLAIGNYWVYDVYRKDTLGNETLHSSSDSAYVDRDTIINNRTFYIIEGDFYATLTTGNIIRNEDNSVIYFDPKDNTEKISFTTNNSEIVYDTKNIGNNMFKLSVWTNIGLQSIVVPAGQYSCNERETEILPLTQNYPWGTRSQFRYYNNTVGVVYDQFYFASSPDIYNTKLVRYNIN